MRDIIKVFLLANVLIISLFSSLLFLHSLTENKISEKLIEKVFFIYILSSITLWWYLNRFYIEENKKIEKTIPLSLLLIGLLCLYNEFFGKALFLGINFLLGNYMAIFFLLGIYVTLGTILYFIGTEIIPSPKMVKRIETKIVVLILALSSLFGEIPQALIVSSIILSMTYLTLTRLYGYKKIFALEILLLSSLSLLSIVFKKGILQSMFSIMVISNIFYINLLQERGWLLLRKNPNDYIALSLMLVLFSSLFMITEVMEFLASLVLFYISLKIIEGIKKEI